MTYTPTEEHSFYRSMLEVCIKSPDMATWAIETLFFPRLPDDLLSLLPKQQPSFESTSSGSEDEVLDLEYAIVLRYAKTEIAYLIEAEHHVSLFQISELAYQLFQVRRVMLIDEKTNQKMFCDRTTSRGWELYSL